MVRFFNAYFPTRTLLLGVSETLLVLLGFVLATVMRFGTEDLDIVFNYQGGLVKILVVTFTLTLCMYYFDLYDSLVLSNRREALTRLVQVIGASSVILSVLYYLYPGLRLARGVFVPGTILVAISLVVARRAFLSLNMSDRLAERTLLVGDGPLAPQLSAEIERRPELGVQLVGFVNKTQDSIPREIDVPRLGNLEDLPELVRSRDIDRIIVTMADRRGKLPVEELLRLKQSGVQIQDGAEFYESITGKLPLDSLRLSWLLFSPGFCVSRALLIYKRIFSLVVSFLGIVITLPIMLLTAIAIRLDSPGPAIFRQKRIGKDGRTFTLYKFRSMRVDADGNGKEKPAEADDHRFTRVGRWLRRVRLDELPQLLNIFKGDMYFVGPRPFVPSQEEELAEKIPFYRQRWSVKPGATGWAQINRGYCATIEDNAEKLSYDLFYIKNVSIGLDLLILFQTVKILLLGRGGR